MIRTAATPLKAALVATLLATATLTAPAAQAGGFVSINLQPRNADEDRAMRTGLALYSLFNNVKGSGSITQKGSGNAAGIAQDGRGNFGVVHQKGKGHNGTVTQTGNNNSYGLFQFGRNTNGHAVQNGHGGTGATFQFGW